MKQPKTPTLDQLYALQQLAHRERSRAQAAMVRAVARWIKETVQKVFLRPYARAPRKAAFHG